MCLYPRLIINRKYTPNKKNGGNAPPLKDPRTLYVPVGCNKCIECTKQKARGWQVRLNEHIRTHHTGKFITFTFSNESIAKLAKKFKLEGYLLDNEIATLATRRFLERWRKKYKISIEHWLITELGTQNTENIHLHGILFTNKYKHAKLLPGIAQQYEQEQIQDLENIWQYGHIFRGQWVNEQTVNYIIKYVHKVDTKHPNYQPKILTSKGIGSNYINRPDATKNQFQNDKTDERYYTRKGIKINLPIYYRNKIYNEDEREELWLQKLDKQERWVLGQKIDISTDKGIKRYNTAVKYARRQNRLLGYGNDEKNWDKIRYENQLRKIKQETRIKRGAKGAARRPKL